MPGTQVMNILPTFVGFDAPTSTIPRAAKPYIGDRRKLSHGQTTRFVEHAPPALFR